MNRGCVWTWLVVGLLWDGLHAEVTVNSLREAAVRWERELPCTNWNCECALKRVRGCCCGASDLTETEDQVFLRMMDLSKDLHQLREDVLQTTGGVKVSFTASMSPSTQCFGPFSRTRPIPYDSISLNHGSGYNPALGVFTAPRAGLYSFSISIYSKVGTAGNRMYHKVQLMKNGEVVASMWEDNRDDTEDSSSHTVLLSLQRGGQVYVELLNGRKLCGSVKGLNTFSGTLIYPNVVQ